MPELVLWLRLVQADLMRGVWHPDEGSFGFTGVTEIWSDGVGALYRANALHRISA